MDQNSPVLGESNDMNDNFLQALLFMNMQNSLGS
jgi:hypothetical protein